MSEPREKGRITAEIGQDVIEQALKSVHKHTGGGEEIPIEMEAASGEASSNVGPSEAETALAKEVEQLKLQLDFSQSKGRELMEKVKESHERMLRAVADLDNFKKRAQKEKEEAQKFGVERLLKDFLPVIDNLERALEHARSATDFDSLKTGVVMTRKLFEDSLSRNGVKPFSAKGKPFDPMRHEAMSQVETAEMPPNQVYQEVLRGYTLNDRLVRPALVMVSKALSQAPAPIAADPVTPVDAEAAPEVQPAAASAAGTTSEAK